MKKLLCTLTAALVITGCSTQSYLLDTKTVNSEQAIPNHEITQSFFLHGIGQQKTIDANKYCNGINNISKVDTIQTAGDLFMGFITFTIYTPRTVNIYCK